MLKLVWLIPVLPLFGFLLNFILGRYLRLSERAVSVIACGTVLLSLLITLGAFYEYGWQWAPTHGNQPYNTCKEGGFCFTWLPGRQAHKILGQPSGPLET